MNILKLTITVWVILNNLPGLALNSDRNTKQKLGVEIIDNTNPNKDEALLYYRIEKEYDSHILNIEADYKIKKEERELKLKLEVEF